MDQHVTESAAGAAGAAGPWEAVTAAMSRRGFLGGAAAFVAATCALGGPLAQRVGAIDPATRATMQGLLAFLVPGDDEFSRRQGVTAPRPGGVGADAAPFVERTYDEALPFPIVGEGFDFKLPGSVTVATLLNTTATAVNPFAGLGPFPSAFANLTFNDKAEVFQRLDEDTPVFDGTIVRFILNTVPTLATFVAFSEAPRLDRSTRQLFGQPVGWDLTAYPGPREGWDEFRGYYRGVSRID